MRNGLHLQESNLHLQEQNTSDYAYDGIIGECPKMQEIFEVTSQVAGTDSTVLILGETGTGKELIARAIHQASNRRDKIMVKVNCAALPHHLCDSELFGHERGSFTGAIDRRIGKFEQAHNGTIFLDEIGDMPPDLQVKLLRALQEKEIERLGGNHVVRVDVRVIAATNKDLWKETQEGRFRMDLYYRLNVFPITLPSLRERKADIPALAMHFIHQLSDKTGKPVDGITSKALDKLMDYTWPGNVRELEHVIERSLLLTKGDIIQDIYLPEERFPVAAKSECLTKTIDQNERDHILNVLRICKGKIMGQGGAAELLGVPPTTLNSKLKKLGIKKSYMVAV